MCRCAPALVALLLLTVTGAPASARALDTIHVSGRTAAGRDASFTLVHQAVTGGAVSYDTGCTLGQGTIQLDRPVLNDDRSHVDAHGTHHRQFWMSGHIGPPNPPRGPHDPPNVPRGYHLAVHTSKDSHGRVRVHGSLRLSIEGCHSHDQLALEYTRTMAGRSTAGSRVSVVLNGALEVVGGAVAFRPVQECPNELTLHAPLYQPVVTTETREVDADGTRRVRTHTRSLTPASGVQLALTVTEDPHGVLAAHGVFGAGAFSKTYHRGCDATGEFWLPN
jgi:hypothetical protein